MKVLSMTAQVAIMLSIATTGSAQPHWSQFRGPGGLGIASAEHATPIELNASTLLWSRPLGPGHSSPCIWGDRIFLTSCDQDQLKTVCVDRVNGKVVWERAVVAAKLERTHQINGKATPTPTTDGERVYVYFGSYGLLCYDFEGQEQWKRPLPAPENTFGTASSPIMARGKLIFCCDGKDESYLEAIDGTTGETIWKKERPGFYSGWSSPMFWSRDGVDEIVVCGVWWLTAYNLLDGSERWAAPGLTDEPCITPVHGDGLVFVTSYNMKTSPEVIGIPPFGDLLTEYDKDQNNQLSFDEIRSNQSILSRNDADGEGDHPLRGFYRFLDEDRNGQLTVKEWEKMLAFLDQYKHENALMAIRPATETKDTEIVWKHPSGVPECPSPLFHDGRVYMVKNGGIVSCLDALTGEVRYQERLDAGGPYYASPIACRGNIYLASARGVVTVLRDGNELQVLAHSDLKERIMATPAIVDGQLFVRTDKALHVFANHVD